MVEWRIYFLFMLLSSRAIGAFPLSKRTSSGISTRRFRFASSTSSNSEAQAPNASAGAPRPIRLEKFPNAALDKSLVPDQIGHSGINKSVQGQIYFEAPAQKVTPKALNELLTPSAIGSTGIGKHIPIQIHFPDPDKPKSADALLIPDTLESGGTGFRAILTPDTIGASGISKSIPVQIHFPGLDDNDDNNPTEAILIPDTLTEAGGTGYSGTLRTDTIGRSGIRKSTPFQVHFPELETKGTPKALNELLTPSSIGQSGIGKHIPIQIHFPEPEQEKLPQAFLIPDSLESGGGTGFRGSLQPDTIGRSGISKSIPVQVHFPRPELEETSPAEAVLIPDTLVSGGTGYSASLRIDTIGRSGISKSIPFQVHFPKPQGRASAKALDELLQPDTIGNSGIGKSVPIEIHFAQSEGKGITARAFNDFVALGTIGNSGIIKSIPIQIHFPASQGRVTAEPLDAFLIPDTIGYSGVSKTIPTERRRLPPPSLPRLSSASEQPSRKPLRSFNAGTGTLVPSNPTFSPQRKFTTTTATTRSATTERNDVEMSQNPTTWLEGSADAIARCVLPLTYDSHKGASGRVGILGGSAQYTGAPYYAAMASLNSGSDLAYVFCADEACLPIKSYSPELMVAPVYNAAAFDAVAESYDEDKKKQLVSNMVQKVTSKLEHLHCLVIGPGLGRCPIVCEATAEIIRFAKQQNLAMVLDADALWMLAQPEYRNLFEGYSTAPVVLTPNVVEYKRLKENLSDSQLQSVTIVQKGKNDVIIQDGIETLECHEIGGKKRSGGIGDVLAGTLGTMVAWNRILKRESAKENLALACWTACCFVKHATVRAYNAKKRSMTAPDVLNELGPAMNLMTGEEDVKSPTSNL